MNNKFLFLALSFLICGCGGATIPTPMSEAKLVPMIRVLAFQHNYKENTATLTIVRDKGYVGSFCNLTVYINKIRAATFAVGEYKEFYIEPGEVLLRVDWAPEGEGICSARGRWTQRETLLKPGEKKSFRLSIDSNAKLDIQRFD